MPPPQIKYGGDEDGIQECRRVPPPNLKHRGDDDYKVTRMMKRSRDDAENKGQMQSGSNLSALVRQAPNDAQLMEVAPD